MVLDVRLTCSQPSLNQTKEDGRVRGWCGPVRSGLPKRNAEVVLGDSMR